MRFTIVGTDAAGLALEFVIDARNADEAEYLARNRGVKVSKVSLGTSRAAAAAEAAAKSGAAATPTPAATPPARESLKAAVVAPTPVPASNSPTTAPAPMPRPSPVMSTARAPSTPGKPPSSRTHLNLGLASLALAAIALLFCWIPTVGLISLPLGALALLAGLAGMAAAMRRLPAPAPTLPSRLAAPAGGLTLSLLTLFAGAVFAGASPRGLSLGGPAESPSTTPDAQAPASEPQARAPQPRNLSIVAADGRGNEGLVPNEAARTSPAAPAPQAAPVRLGSAEIRVLSCSIGPVPLVGDQGRSAGITAIPLLSMRVEITNLGSEPISYTSMAGDEQGGLNEGATLTDASGVALRRAQFGFAVVPAGRIARETIYPGRSVTDVLAFERPASPSSHFVLKAFGRCVGSEGSAEIVAPAPPGR